MIDLAKGPFIMHEIVATFAGLTFIFRPSAQILPLTPQARLILECYGGLILYSNLIGLVFLLRPVDETTRLAALAFGWWHAWPSYRALVRMYKEIETKGEMGKTLGGPPVHFTVHAIMFFWFIYVGLGS